MKGLTLSTVLIMLSAPLMADTYDELKQIPGYTNYQLNLSCANMVSGLRGDIVPVRLTGNITRVSFGQFSIQSQLGKFALDISVRAGENEDHSYRTDDNSRVFSKYRDLKEGETAANQELIIGWLQRETAPNLNGTCGNHSLCTVIDDASVDPHINYDRSYKKMFWVPTESSWRAPIQAQQPQLTAEGQNGYTVANVRWGTADGGASYRWKTAAIDVNKLNKIYLMKKPIPEWGKDMSHYFLLFTFSDGGFVADGESSRGLVVSVEARWRNDVQMSRDNVLGNAFNITYVLASWEDYLATNCGPINKGKDNTIIPSEMKLDFGQAVQALDRALKFASKDWEGEYYHGISNNCLTGAVRIVNGALMEPERISFDNSNLDKFLYPAGTPITPANYKNVSVWPK